MSPCSAAKCQRRIFWISRSNNSNNSTTEGMGIASTTQQLEVKIRNVANWMPGGLGGICESPPHYGVSFVGPPNYFGGARRPRRHMRLWGRYLLEPVPVKLSNKHVANERERIDYEQAVVRVLRRRCENAVLPDAAMPAAVTPVHGH